MAILRVVLDTNVIVSGLAYPDSPPGRLMAAWRSGQIELVTSRYILDEVARVLPKVSRGRLTQSEVLDLVDSFRFTTNVVEPIAVDDPDLRDTNDAPILGTFLSGKADWLVTGDKDLLALTERYAIIRPADMWQRFGG